jgi:hypothetical protein
VARLSQRLDHELPLDGLEVHAARRQRTPRWHCPRSGAGSRSGHREMLAADHAAVREDDRARSMAFLSSRTFPGHA